MIAQVVQLITGFIDTIMMGRMGTEILAADGFAALIFISIMIITSSIVMGVSPLIAKAFDAEQKTRIQPIISQGLWALLVSILVMMLMTNLDTWMRYTNQAETTVVLVNTYLDIIIWGLFPRYRPNSFSYESNIYHSYCCSNGRKNKC